MKPDYDTIAGTYDRRYADNDYSGVETALAAFVGSDPRTRVLEAGCGTGHWLRMLDERSIRTAGLDLSARMLARAHALAPRVQLVRGTAEHLPWPGQSFDRVFCINALHHFEDKIAFLREAQRVLRGGGQMMTVGLDPHAGVDRWYIYDYFEPALEIDRRRYPSSGRLRAWMVAAGLRNVYTREVQHIPGRLSARAALDQGRLDKVATSQLAVLTDEEYRRGVDRIRRALESAETRGDSLHLIADLRLYATFGSVAPQ